MHKQVGNLTRQLRGVAYEAKQEQKRIKLARREFVLFSLLVALLLGVDYTSALIIFSYLDPTLGQVSLGPELIALCVPIAVVAVHLLVADDGGKTIEHRLKRLAGVGVFVFLIGMAGMLSLVYLDSADGVGSESSGGVQGTIGSQEIGSGGGETSLFFSIFQGIFAGVVPAVFFIGMCLILFVTIYVSHKLLAKIEERYEFFSNASSRSKELLERFALAEQKGAELVQLDGRIRRAKSKLPRDPEHRFAEITSAAISEALHRMNRNLRGLDEPGDLLLEAVQRKESVPSHIESQKDGRRKIAEIRQASTPYAILTTLSGMAADEEE